MPEIKRVKEKEEKKILEIPGVAGVGIGEERKSAPRKIITVYVESADPRILGQIPEDIDGFPIRIIESGKFKVLQQQVLSHAGTRFRPSPGGVSISHLNVTAGTLASRVYDSVNGQRLILSNNHVIANEDSIQNPSANTGDWILQPGTADGGTDPDDRLATLLRWIQIDEQGDNIVDAGVAQPISDSELRDDILGIGTVTEAAEVVINELVKKYGRTSHLTASTVIDVNATISVEYSGFTTIFTDQIITGFMGSPGDSGSLLVNFKNQAVGLLFAGSNSLTAFNKIENVMNQLGVHFGVPGIFPSAQIFSSGAGSLMPLLILGGMMLVFI
jgi:hypothetical protein